MGLNSDFNIYRVVVRVWKSAGGGGGVIGSKALMKGTSGGWKHWLKAGDSGKHSQ
jgi:hypothetical protein